jgi:hypothetical protein
MVKLIVITIFQRNNLLKFSQSIFAITSRNMSYKPTGKARTSLEEMDKSGEYKRTDSTFREIISADHPEFKPEAGRYHLYISLAW